VPTSDRSGSAPAGPPGAAAVAGALWSGEGTVGGAAASASAASRSTGAAGARELVRYLHLAGRPGTGPAPGRPARGSVVGVLWAWEGAAGHVGRERFGGVP
jgi:hypothetical protein